MASSGWIWRVPGSRTARWTYTVARFPCTLTSVWRCNATCGGRGRMLRPSLQLAASSGFAKGGTGEPPPRGAADRTEVDANFLKVLEILFERGDRFAVATHDEALIDRALELSRTYRRRFEFQMLLGVRDPLKDDLTAKGHRVLDYIPYGPNWLPYFTRRLRERPPNIITMVRSFVSG